MATFTASNGNKANGNGNGAVTPPAGTKLPVTFSDGSVHMLPENVALEMIAAQQAAAEAAAENAALKASGGRSRNVIALKVGEKGGIVLSGLGSRWPVTLYAAQWEALMVYLKADAANPLAAFIAANETHLDRKS